MDTKTSSIPLMWYNKLGSLVSVCLSSNVSCVRRRAPCTIFGRRPIFRGARHTNGKGSCNFFVVVALFRFGIYFYFAYRNSTFELWMANNLASFLLLGDPNGWIFNGGVYLNPPLSSIRVYRVTYEAYAVHMYSKVYEYEAYMGGCVFALLIASREIISFGWGLKNSATYEYSIIIQGLFCMKKSCKRIIQ